MTSKILLFNRAMMVFLSLMILITGGARGQDTDEEKESKGSLSLSGYVDTYYSYNFNDPSNSDNFGTTGVGRIFDGYHNQVALGLAQFVTSYSTDRTEIVADIVFGPNAELANFGNVGTAFSIKQAYVSTTLVDGLTLTMGQYGTHIGYELVDAPSNMHYSLSNLFGNGPFYHTGAKLDYAISDQFGLMVGVVNGWDAIQDNNTSKSVAAQFSLAPVEGLDAYINWLGGNEAANNPITGDKADAYKHMFDLTASYAVADNFNIGINAAMGFDRAGTVNNDWMGAALYLTFSASDRVDLGVRGEYFDDSNDIQYLGAAYQGITLTASITALDGAVIVKPEFRFDNADEDIYYKGLNTLSQSQSTLGLAIIGTFGN
ncbi:MAG: porin [Cyclobacteriaceae bacterium]|nr:porin [Cyclobacteriaceae bacterium]